jgi:hypothetical protein
VFQYADEIAVTYQAKTFDECENNHEADIEVYIEPIFSSLVPSTESRKNWNVRIPPQHACCQQTTGCDVQRHFNQTCGSS